MVAIQIHQHIHGSSEMLNIATMERIQWHPVRSFNENPLSIDDKGEVTVAVSIYGFSSPQLNFSESNTSLPFAQGIHGRTQQSQLDVIQ